MQLSETVPANYGGVRSTSDGTAMGLVCRAYWEDMEPWAPLNQKVSVTVDDWQIQEYLRGNRDRPIQIFHEWGSNVLYGLLKTKRDAGAPVQFTIPLVTGETVTITLAVILEILMESRVRVTQGQIPGLTLIARGLE